MIEIFVNRYIFFVILDMFFFVFRFFLNVFLLSRCWLAGAAYMTEEWSEPVFPFIRGAFSLRPSLSISPSLVFSGIPRRTGGGGGGSFPWVEREMGWRGNKLRL